MCGGGPPQTGPASASVCGGPGVGRSAGPRVISAPALGPPPRRTMRAEGVTLRIRVVLGVGTAIALAVGVGTWIATRPAAAPAPAATAETTGS